MWQFVTNFAEGDEKHRAFIKGKTNKQKLQYDGIFFILSVCTIWSCCDVLLKLQKIKTQFLQHPELDSSLLRWLSPPDPSTNYNIARKAHHNGTAEWFFRGSIFNQWKSTASFLWVHGKRALLSALTKRQLLIVSIHQQNHNFLYNFIAFLALRHIFVK